VKFARILAIVTLSVTLSALLFLALVCGWLFEFFLYREPDVQPSLIVWEDVGLSFKNDTALVVDRGIQDSVKNLLKSVYPEKTFMFVFVDEPGTLKSYFELVDKLSKNRIYPKFPIDVFVAVR
jgi:hypothetical protein